MPQLNPGPWFVMLVSTWFVFLIIIPPKILAHAFPGELSALSTHKPKYNTWNWPWQ